MSETPQKQEQGAAGHFTMQLVGGAIGWFVFKWLEYKYNYHLPAGDESGAGTGFGLMAGALWWLFGPRIKRWRNKR